jgi:hypothetical protein
VIEERRDAQTPCPVWQRTELSDSQVVRSPAVWPTAEETVYPASPKLAPCTVTLADPVAPLFARLIPLVGEDSDENASEALPTRAPILATNRRLPATPCPKPHRIDVSDSQLVLSHAVCPGRIPPLYPPCPRPPPSTVTLGDPVPAAFARLCTLSESRSADISCVTVPTCTSTVTLVRRVPITLLASRDWTLESEIHSVDSQPVCPILDDSDMTMMPKFTPPTVMLADPVDAQFIRSAILSDGMSKEYTREELPTCSPAVIATRRLPPPPGPLKQRIDVSEIQLVASHAVWPIRISALEATIPKSEPCMDTEKWPAMIRFDPRNSSNEGMSIENSSDTEPPTCPALAERRLVPISPCPVRHRTDESDSHVVSSHPVWPKRIPPEYDPSPRFIPFTVKLDDPLVALFVLRTTLKAPPSMEYPPLRLPGLSPTLSHTLTLATAPCPPWQRNDVSDSHVVRSHADRPNRTAPVDETSPTLAPSRVTLVDPLAPWFVRLSTLAHGTSTEKSVVLLPPPSPTVSDTRLLPVTPSVTWLRIDVPDSHALRSHEDCPERNVDVNVAEPRFPPTKVKLEDPVAARLLCLAALSDGVSTERTSVMLPARWPAVTADRRLPPTPSTARHVTDVSDSQELPSQAVYPTRIAPVYTASPVLAPSIVTLCEPVAPRLL